MNTHDELVKRLRKTSVLDHPMEARHAMDIASLALQHADTRAAEDRALIQMLQKALAYWMPSVFDERSAQDAYLLSGYEGPDEAKCWGDAQVQIAKEAVERAAGLEQPTLDMIQAGLAVRWPALYRDCLYGEHDGIHLRAETETRINMMRQQYLAMVGAAQKEA